MLFLFIGFMAAIAADFSLYLTYMSGGNDIENTTILPEECQEESGSSSGDGELQIHQVSEGVLELSFFNFSPEIKSDQTSSDPENGFHQIPYSPPERV